MLYLLGFVFTAEAHGSEGDADEENLEAAKAMFNKGTAAFKAAQYPEAAKAFRAAHETRPNWKLLYNIAQSEAASKRHGLALTEFEKYLALGGDDIAEERRREVETEIARLKKMVGYVAIQAPEAAAITIDGVERGTAPISGVLPVSGSVVHEVVVILENGESLAPRKVSLVSGKEVTLTFVDQKEPTYGTDSPETASSESASSPAKDDSKSAPLKLSGWITLGVGAAVLIGAGVTGGLALSAGKEVDEKCPNGCYEPEHAVLERRDNLALTTDVLFAVGGTAAAAGIALVIVHHMKTRREHRGSESVSVIPSLDNGTIGASFSLRF